MTPSPEESLDIEALKPCPFCGGEDVWDASTLAKQQEESGELREKVARLVDWAMKRSIGTPPMPREEIITFATDQILALLPAPPKGRE